MTHSGKYDLEIPGDYWLLRLQMRESVGAIISARKCNEQEAETLLLDEIGCTLEGFLREAIDNICRLTRVRSESERAQDQAKWQALQNRLKQMIQDDKGKPRQVTLTEPDEPALVILRPGQSPEFVPNDVARGLLAQLVSCRDIAQSAVNRAQH